MGGDNLRRYAEEGRGVGGPVLDLQGPQHSVVLSLLHDAEVLPHNVLLE